MCEDDYGEWRPYMICEMDQILAGIEDGDSDALDLACDWLNDLVVAGDPDVIATMLRGWQHEMIVGLEDDRGGGDSVQAPAE